MSEPMSARWPRLTEDLGDQGWQRCQECGADGEIGEDLTAWQEHDDRDRPEPRAVVLCAPCSDRIIEPHPRLYRRLEPMAPMPGAMLLCEACDHRDRYLCRHPDLTINSGEGLVIRFPEATQYHASGTRGGRRTGWWGMLYSGHPTECEGREVSGD